METRAQIEENHPKSIPVVAKLCNKDKRKGMEKFGMHSKELSSDSDSATLNNSPEGNHKNHTR